MSLQERQERANEIMAREFPKGGPGFGNIHFVFVAADKIWLAKIKGVFTGVQLRALTNVVEIMNEGAEEDAEKAAVVLKGGGEGGMILDDSTFLV